MRLAKVTIAGFKSFADPVEIRFDSPKVGIVGPNGCGKSNIVDAIKWVLGERSAKSLRGEAMLDVIFAGSAGRKPLGAASVTLSFDNPVIRPDSKDPSHRRALALDTDTVDVGRRLYRDGRSEYLLNGTICRLKDVRELFMDTGVGANTYSIIEQGKVSAMLTGSPVERRTLIEEAAGVSKFKARKLEASRKLERTEVNLVRVREQLASTERRLRIVRGQAVKARKFKELDVRYRELRTELTLDQYHELQERLTGLTSRLADLNEQCRGLEVHLHELDEQSQQAELDRHERQEARQELDRRLSGNEGAVRQAEQRRGMLDNRLAELRQQQVLDVERVRELEHRLRSQEDDLDNASEAMTTASQQLSETERLVDEVSREVAQLHQQTEQEDRQVSTHRNERERSLARRSHLQSTLTSIEGRTRAIQEQLERLEQRRVSLADERATLEQDRVENDRGLEAVRLVVRQFETELAAHDNAATTLGEQHADLTERLSAIRHDRAGRGSRLHLLEEMQGAREGLTDAVKNILQNRDEWPGITGMLGDALATSREHASLVESALGADLELLLVQDQDALRSLADRLMDSGSQVALHVSNTRTASGDPSTLPEGATPILDLIDIQPEALSAANALLGHTAVVDDLATALSCQQAPWRFVTRTGLVLEANGCIRLSGQRTGNENGWLSRRLEIEDLGTEVESLDLRIGSMNDDLAELLSESTQAREKQKDTSRQLSEQLNKVADLEYNQRRFDTDLERLVRETRSSTAEYDELAQRRDGHLAEAKAIAEQVGQLDDECNALDALITDAETASQVITDQWHVAQERLTKLRVDLGQVSEHYEARQRERSHLAILLEEANGELTRQRDLANSQRAAIDQHEAGLSACDEEIASARQSVAQARAAIEQADQGLAETSEHVTTIRSQLEAARARSKQLERDHNALEISRREAEIKRENAEERALEDLEIDLAIVWKDQAQRRREADPSNAIDRDAAEAEVAELRDTIKSLGNVNLDSIEEETNLEERNEDLVQQVEDIDLAKIQLTTLIEDLDIKCRERFEQTFNDIREHFAGSNGMFRQLFNGGSADLYLQPDEDGHIDPLEAGIEITAKPPGKKPRVLKQLSGGEQALTSVALVMAIFRSKPSPFCILDEVDAPLDEANKERFCDTLDQFLDQSHFIVITHSKVTMLNCDELYGITQQERGVSKLVNVEVDDIGEEGQIRKSTAIKAPPSDSPPPVIVTQPAATEAMAEATSPQAQLTGE
ncbi:MAG: chromosome segregation protein SMC [Phycisphaerales bacterium]|nr:chromosome segregation protein SMC [Phycisphaerales bacterium]